MMNSLLPVLGLLLLGSAAAFAAPDDASGDFDVITKVERLDTALPEGSRAADAFLRESFLKKEEEAAPTNMLVRDWEMHARVCTASLVARARALGLEADALEAILAAQQRERGSLAIVPIAAYRAEQGASPVWIVVAKWEIASVASTPNIRLGHIRVAAFAIASRRQVASATCM